MKRYKLLSDNGITMKEGELSKEFIPTIIKYGSLFFTLRNAAAMILVYDEATVYIIT